MKKEEENHACKDVFSFKLQPVMRRETHIVDRSVDDDIAEPVVTVPLWLLDVGVAFVFALAAVFDVGPTPVIKR